MEYALLAPSQLSWRPPQTKVVEGTCCYCGHYTIEWLSSWQHSQIPLVLLKYFCLLELDLTDGMLPCILRIPLSYRVKTSFSKDKRAL